MSKFSEHDDVIDSREIIERIEELREELNGEPTSGSRDELYAELRALEKLDSEGRDASEDWEYGVTLVNDSYFVEYAQELAEDIGAIGRGGEASWPMYCIDWDKAAEELQLDYWPIEFDGQTFWVQS